MTKSLEHDAFRGNHCSWGTKGKPVELPDRLITDRVPPTLTYLCCEKESAASLTCLERRDASNLIKHGPAKGPHGNAPQGAPNGREEKAKSTTRPGRRRGPGAGAGRRSRAGCPTAQDRHPE